MKISIKIGAVAAAGIAVVAVAANLGTIYDNACKYLFSCGDNSRSAETQKTRENVIVVLCNGKVQRDVNGVVTCTTSSSPNIQAPNPMDDRHVDNQNQRSPARESNPQKQQVCEDLRPFGLSDPRPCDSALARKLFTVNQ
ncbi:MAG: hypothetical protein ABL904_13890 [Hyphomicrobiaceae bacterium]